MAIAASTTCWATSVETLLMPGKVAQAHVKQEETCAACHDRSNTRTQASLCLDCHKDIAADLTTHRGYHGRMANASAGECRACHTEHRGREADIVHLDLTQFDHRQTDFLLDGAHARLDCAACHKRGTPWRKAPATCQDCHKKDDVHLGQFAQACGECHATSSWSGGKFDHDRLNFKLTGAHSALSCNACHVAQNYKSAPESCLGCHSTDDVHRGSRGEDCAKCHTTKEWKSAKFDHLKETGFALSGAHRDIDCGACHRNGNYREKLPKDCHGCHSSDDAHAARFGEACADCHDNDRWRPVNYDHAQRHHFQLTGAHAKIDCHSCHTGVSHSQRLAEDCAGCHRASDPHGGKLKGGCQSCHGQIAWRSDITFDHDLTSYPLVGLHRLASCVQCHDTLTFARASENCVGCHASQDVHKGGLGRQCENCHSPSGWPLWTFDHEKDAHFPLVGGHSKLACAACHREGFAKTSQQCVSCHRKDDRHVGQYGEQCERCHAPYSWKGARVQ